jgi:hypothetical protein
VSDFAQTGSSNVPKIASFAIGNAEFANMNFLPNPFIALITGAALNRRGNWTPFGA